MTGCGLLRSREAPRLCLPAVLTVTSPDVWPSLKVDVTRPMVHVPVPSHRRHFHPETALTDCIAYYFAYANKRSKSAPPAIARQRILTKRLAATALIRVVEAFSTVLTNRDRHFAETVEFVNATRRAKELGCPIVVGDFEDMVKKTDPRLMVDCVSAALGVGVLIFDARAGGLVDPKGLAETVKFLQRDAIARRQNIQIGLQLSKTERGTRANNQPKAAKATVLKADRSALRLEAVIQQVRDELPANTTLTPTILARALNERQILSDRGNAWSRGTAARVLKRLEALGSAKT